MKKKKHKNKRFSIFLLKITILNNTRILDFNKINSDLVL